MKITNDTPTELDLKDSNIAGLIIGAIMLAVGGVYSFNLYFTAGLSTNLYIALGVAVIGIVLLLTVASISVQINKASGQISFQKKRLIGSQNKNLNIVDALRVELRKAYHIEHGARGNNAIMTPSREVLNYQSVIVFKDGTEVPLENQKSAGSSGLNGMILMGGTGKEMAMATKVANFLNVPFLEVGPGSAPIDIGIGKI